MDIHISKGINCINKPDPVLWKFFYVPTIEFVSLNPSLQAHPLLPFNDRNNQIFAYFLLSFRKQYCGFINSFIQSLMLFIFLPELLITLQF